MISTLVNYKRSRLLTSRSHSKVFTHSVLYLNISQGKERHLHSSVELNYLQTLIAIYAGVIRYYFEPLTAPTGFQITFPPRFKVIKLHFIPPTNGQLTLDCVRQLSELTVDLLFSLREKETSGIWIVLPQKAKHIENKSNST